MSMTRRVVGAGSVLLTLFLASLSGPLTAQAPATPASAAIPAQPDADRMYAAIRAGDTTLVRSLLDEGTDVNLVERRGGATPLMHAAAVGSLDTMRLLMSRGANVNAKSYGGMTALMWAVADLARVRLLVEKGADVNIASANGRTALMLAAMGGTSAPIVRYFLPHGANPRAVDNGHVTTVLAATIGNDAASIRQIVEAGGDVNAAVTGEDVGDFVGTTPLMSAAAAGNTEAVRFLLAHGARVNAVSGPPNAKVKNGTIAIGSLTPLLLASTYGPEPVVKALIAAGADVNVTDARGMTPLMLSVSADHGDPAVTKTLLASGANTGRISLSRESAMDWALKSGATPRVTMLKVAGAPVASSAAVPAAAVRARTMRADPAAIRGAVERGLALIQPATGTFFVNGGCAACHSQNITDIAAGEARRAGITVDENGARARDAGAAAQFASLATRLLERLDPPAIDIPLYTLAGFAAVEHPADRATDALVHNVAVRQTGTGAWHPGGIARPPLSDGDAASTALGIRALAVYGPPGRRPELTDRIRRAMQFLRGIKPITAQDRAFRMLGLFWGGAPPLTLGAYIKDAAAAQRADGGWSQNATLESDAYSTSIILYSLIKAGVPAGDNTITRAVGYLLGSQHDDGSWYVRSRAPKFQPYFDGGFPYEHDQWISSMATGWATTALASTLAADAPRRVAQ
jgi:ankyrin repeat protein